MKIKLTFEHDKQYGNDRFFPTNELARVVCSVAKRKTFNEEELKVLQAGGFEIETHYKYTFKPLQPKNEGN